MTIFERIREAQGRYNLTQAQFAQIAGIRETYMSQIMNAEPDLRLSTYTKLETALKVLEAGAAAR